jgi:hypothetical protein
MAGKCNEMVEEDCIVLLAVEQRCKGCVKAEGYLAAGERSVEMQFSGVDS